MLTAALLAVTRMSTMLQEGTYAATHPPVFAGQYALRLCKASCSTNAPFLTGTLVLFARPLRDAQGRAIDMPQENGPANGCFVLKQGSGPPGVLHGFDVRQGYLVWQQSYTPDSIRLALWHSPDAFYGVNLKFSGKGLSGSGRLAIDLPGTATGQKPASDAVVADRMAEPDRHACPPPRTQEVAVSSAQTHQIAAWVRSFASR